MPDAVVWEMVHSKEELNTEFAENTEKGRGVKKKRACETKEVNGLCNSHIETSALGTGPTSGRGKVVKAGLGAQNG
jgi:hypothetical protein